MRRKAISKTKGQVLSLMIPTCRSDNAHTCMSSVSTSINVSGPGVSDSLHLRIVLEGMAGSAVFSVQPVGKLAHCSEWGSCHPGI